VPLIKKKASSLLFLSAINYNLWFNIGNRAIGESYTKSLPQWGKGDHAVVDEVVPLSRYKTE
jgi:hypothetical protein